MQALIQPKINSSYIFQGHTNTEPRDLQIFNIGALLAVPLSGEVRQQALIATLLFGEVCLYDRDLHL